MKNNHSVDIPLLFFAFAFFIVLLGLFSKFSFQKQNSIQPTSVPQQMSMPSPHKLDYNLPILCDYRTKDSSTSAMVDGNSVRATVINNTTVKKYVVQGDCMYSWNNNELKGTKKCGIGNYIVMGKQLLSSGVGSIDSIANMLQQSGKASTINIQAVFETCRNVKEIKKEVFFIPNNIKFE
jgi:hypothetical protein